MANIKSAKKRVLVSQVVEAESVMRKAASKGVYHDNTVSRKISRMNKAVNAMN